MAAGCSRGRPPRRRFPASTSAVSAAVRAYICPGERYTPRPAPKRIRAFGYCARCAAGARGTAGDSELRFFRNGLFCVCVCVCSCTRAGVYIIQIQSGGKSVFVRLAVYVVNETTPRRPCDFFSRDFFPFFYFFVRY